MITYNLTLTTRPAWFLYTTPPAPWSSPEKPMGKTMLLGGWTNPFEKICVKLDHFPKDRGEHKKYLKPPTSMCHKRVSFGIIANFPSSKVLEGLTLQIFVAQKMKV